MQCNPRMVSQEIGIAALPDRRVCDQTIRNRSHEQGLRSRVRVEVPIMLVAHRQARLQYAYAHRNWTQDNG